MSTCTKACQEERTHLAGRLRIWYQNGRTGMQTVCELEGAPQAVKKAVERWYDLGWARLDAIASDLER